jgi:hypothetical protein
MSGVTNSIEEVATKHGSSRLGLKLGSLSAAKRATSSANSHRILNDVATGANQRLSGPNSTKSQRLLAGGPTGADERLGGLKSGKKGKE